MQQLQDNLHTHPVIAFIISICSIVLGFLFRLLGVLSETHIPPIIIELLQCVSYSLGIAVGVITVYTFIKKKGK